MRGLHWLSKTNSIIFEHNELSSVVGISATVNQRVASSHCPGVMHCADLLGARLFVCLFLMLSYSFRLSSVFKVNAYTRLISISFLNTPLTLQKAAA